MPRALQLLAAAVIASLVAAAQTISLENGVITAAGTAPGDSLRVYVVGVAEAPSLLGVTAAVKNGLRFEPRYPLEPGMRYRVEAEGGKLKLDSAPGKGTRISARLPALPESTAATQQPAVAA